MVVGRRWIRGLAGGCRPPAFRHANPAAGAAAAAMVAAVATEAAGCGVMGTMEGGGMSCGDGL